MYLPFSPNIDWAIAEGYVPTNVIKTKKAQVKCDGCGKFMKLDGAYVIVENTYFRSHMKEECLTRVYTKAKARREEFEYAAMGAKQYGRP